MKSFSLLFLFIVFSYATAKEKNSIWNPLTQDNSNKVFQALSEMPNLKVGFEVRLGEYNDPTQPHDWLDPKIVVWKAGDLEINCRIEVTRHGTEANLKKSKCILKVGTITIEYTEGSAVTIFKRLLGPKAYYSKEEQNQNTTIRYDLGPFKILTTQQKNSSPQTALIENKDFLIEKNISKLGISGTGH